MADMVLYITNKTYSSWSMRSWLALTAAGIAFEEKLVPFDLPGGNAQIKAISPSGRVPVLRHGEVTVWESLAIIDYAAELHPEAGLWPSGPAARARARSISMEMHGGFQALRNACPMNLRRPVSRLKVSSEVLADVARIDAIWRESLDLSGGPFLFGAFSAADAMYAPVVSRFTTYGLMQDEVLLAYMDRVRTHPAWLAWCAGAARETAVVSEYEL